MICFDRRRWPGWGGGDTRKGNSSTSVCNENRDGWSWIWFFTLLGIRRGCPCRMEYVQLTAEESSRCF